MEKEADGYKYVYQYKDHLGNIRLSYKDADKDGTITQSEIVEEKNYYPFGLQHQGYNFDVNGSKHNYGFNGIELTESLDLNLYEMDLRQYDPTIARWTSIDPVTHYSLSTYNAFDNNPVFWADPSGANSTQDLIDEASKSPGVTFTNNGDGTFSGGGETIGTANSENESGVLNADGTCCASSGSSKGIEQRGTVKWMQTYNSLSGDEREAWLEEQENGWITAVSLAIPIGGALKIVSIGGKWAVFRILQGGKWVYGAVKAKYALMVLNKTASTFAKSKRIFSGQSHFSKKIANDYLAQMRNGSFNHYKELSSLFDKSGRTIITGGNHRVNAAIKYGTETGNYKYLEQLFNAMRTTQGEAASYGYKILNIIR